MKMENEQSQSDLPKLYIEEAIIKELSPEELERLKNEAMEIILKRLKTKDNL